MDSLKQEIKAWEENRNEKSNSVDWRFTTADARIKLKKLYPSIQTYRLVGTVLETRAWLHAMPDGV